MSKDSDLATVSRTGDLTPEELTNGQKRFEEKISEFTKRTEAVNRSVLELNWEKGSFVNEILSEPKKYANKTVENLAQALGVSPEMVYAWHRFNQRYTREEMEACVAKNLAWHNIYYLLSVSDTGKRKELETQLAKGDLKTPALQEKVKAINASEKKTAKAKGKKVDNRGGLRVGVVVQSTHNMCVSMVRKLDEFHDAWKVWDKMEDGQPKSQMLLNLKSSRKAIQELQEKAGRTLERCEL
jgi:hypothetical protein